MGEKINYFLRLKNVKKTEFIKHLYEWYLFFILQFVLEKL